MGAFERADLVANRSLFVRGASVLAFLAMKTVAHVALALMALSATTPTLSAQTAAPIADPTFQFVASSGCGHVFLYAWNAPRSEVLTARIDIKKLGLGPGTHVIDIASAGDAVAVAVDQYRDPDLWTHHCSDLGPLAKPVATWRAVTGRVTLTIGVPGADSDTTPFTYKTSLRLESLTFVGPQGQKLNASAPVVLSGVVGWVAG